MIQEQEIRCGNWFNHNANWCYRSPTEIKVFNFKWESRDWYALGESTIDLEDVFPIDLSPDILSKAGFVNGELQIGHLSFKFYGPDNLAIHGMLGTIKPYYCKFLHHLQNQIYFLTAIELNITL